MLRVILCCEFFVLFYIFIYFFAKFLHNVTGFLENSQPKALQSHILNIFPDAHYLYFPF